MQYTKYLQLRNNIYYFRFKIPIHLKKLTTQKEIVRSLKTDSLNDACAIISTKSTLLRLLKKMTPTTNELQRLFDELSDFTEVDSYDRYQRDSQSDEIEGMARVVDEVCTDLQDNRLTDFSGITITQPVEANVKRHKSFQRLFVTLVKAQVERAMQGCTVEFDSLLARADKFVEAPQEPLKRLSIYYKKFEKFKSWSEKQQATNNNMYLFLLAHWGDVDVLTVTKKEIRSALLAYSRMPKGNKKPYNSMEVSERYEYSVNSFDDILDKDFIASKTVSELLKLLQGFFSAFLTKELDLFVVSPTDNVQYKMEFVRGGSYTDKEVNVFIEHAKTETDWKKRSILLAIYTGARRSEIVKFLKDGLQTDESGIHFFELKEGKTESAARKVPVHKSLIELGILSVQKITAKEKSITDYTNRLRDSLNIPISDTDGNKRVFHAFRHSFITKSVSKGSSIELIQELVGHRKHRAGITSRYMHNFSLTELSLIVDKITY